MFSAQAQFFFFLGKTLEQNENVPWALMLWKASCQRVLSPSYIIQDFVKI